MLINVLLFLVRLASSLIFKFCCRCTTKFKDSCLFNYYNVEKFKELDG